MKGVKSKLRHYENLTNLKIYKIQEENYFKKISIMPKDRFLKLEGIICNLPINAVDIAYILLCGTDNNGRIVAKLKLN